MEWEVCRCKTAVPLTHVIVQSLKCASIEHRCRRRHAWRDSNHESTRRIPPSLYCSPLQFDSSWLVAQIHATHHLFHKPKSIHCQIHLSQKRLGRTLRKSNPFFLTSRPDLLFVWLIFTRDKSKRESNLKQECSVFYSCSCSCIPLYPKELSSADLMCHMHKWWGDDTGQPGSERGSGSAEHSVNTPECPQTSCTPHEYRALGCKGGMWIGLSA